MNILPIGEYPFEVAGVEDAISKTSGKEMIAMELYVFPPSGGRKMVKDWLVAGTNFGDKKIYEFAHATGLADKYESGTFGAEDCAGKTGYLMLGIQTGKKKNNSEEFFPDRNSVKYYVNKERNKPEAENPKHLESSVPIAQAELDEDVPF